MPDGDCPQLAVLRDGDNPLLQMPCCSQLTSALDQREGGAGGIEDGGGAGGDAGRRLLCVLILPGECLRVSGMQIRSCTALLRNLATSLSTGLQPERAPGGGGGQPGLPCSPLHPLLWGW